MIVLKLLGQPNSYSFHRAYLVVLVYLLYYVDLIIFTGCLPSTENRVHAIQDLCRQGQFSRSVCSTYMFGANTYLLLRTTTFSPFSNQVSAAEMTNSYRFSMSNQTACARKGKGD